MVQRGNQRGIVTRRFGLGRGQAGEDQLDPVQRQKDLGDHIGRYDQHPVAHLAQHVFRGVRDALEPRQPQEATRTLNGVDQAENERERPGIVRRALQPDQRDIQFGQVLRGFGEEVIEQIVHAVGPQGPKVCGRKVRVRFDSARRLRRNGKCPDDLLETVSRESPARSVQSASTVTLA